MKLLIGIPLVAVGLGSQLWGLAIAGGFVLAWWLLADYLPKQS